MSCSKGSVLFFYLFLTPQSARIRLQFTLAGVKLFVYNNHDSAKLKASLNIALIVDANENEMRMLVVAVCW